MTALRRRPLPTLAATAALLTVAVLAVPIALAAGRGYPTESALVQAASTAVVEAGGALPAGRGAALAGLVDLWREFHIVKLALAVGLTVVLVALVRVLGGRARAASPGRPRRRAVVAHSAVLVWLLTTVTVAMANLQGAIAPLASVASLLPTTRPEPGLNAVLADLRQAITAGHPSGSAALAVRLRDDFGLYHGAFAIIATVVGLVLGALAVRAVTRRLRRRGDTAPDPTWVVQGFLLGGAGALVLLVAAANLGTWAHPVPALLASLGG